MPERSNPIPAGFSSDPSICRAGDECYIAAPIFEWFPGVQIHHSRDLAKWRLVTRPLTRAAQLVKRGNPDGRGVREPWLTHADGQFRLGYTDVKRTDGSFRDAHNYPVTAPAIEGPPGNFSGRFAGMAAHDLNGTGAAADFSHFTYDPPRAEARAGAVQPVRFDPEATP